LAYAQRGISALSTRTPGIIFQIDTDADTSTTKPGAGALSHLHDGGQDLILGIADPVSHGGVLTTPPARPGSLSAVPHGPSVTPDLFALIFAIRDAEVLFTFVPPGCVVRRFQVP
jgi:hypothetical protein